MSEPDPSAGVHRPMTTAAVLTLAAALAAPTVMPADGGTPHRTRVETGVCAPDSPAIIASTVTPADCVVLPSDLVPNQFIVNPGEPPTSLGRIQLGEDGEWHFSPSAHLPEQYQAAFLYGIDSYVDRALRNAGDDGPIEVHTYVNPNGGMNLLSFGPDYKSGIVYDSEGMAGFSQVGSVNASLDTSGESELTVGEVRATMVHEVTHAYFNKWIKDPKNADLFKESDALFVAELGYQLESLRQQKGAEIIAELEVYMSGLNPESDWRTIDAVNEVIGSFKTPHGLEGLVIGERDEMAYRMDWVETKGLAARDASLNLQGYGTQAEALSRADQLYMGFIREAYKDVDESTILQDLIADPHHLDLTDNETVASLVAGLRMNPIGLGDAIDTMEPSERRDRYVRQLQIIQELFERNEPEALADLNFATAFSRIQ